MRHEQNAMKNMAANETIEINGNIASKEDIVFKEINENIEK